MKINKINKVLLFVFSPLVIGFVSSLFTSDAISEYANLNKPALSPDGYVFAIVWTILYLLMGISSCLIYLSNHPNRKLALGLNNIQLIINFFWTILFFNLKAYLFSFLWLIMLFITVLAMVYQYKKINDISFYLSLPYVVWLMFAGYLNIAVYLLNR